MSHKLLGVLPVVVLACASGAPQKAAEAPSEKTSAPNSSESLPSEPPPGANTVSAPSSASASTPSDMSSCLMVNVCGCNLGCASISVPAAKLRTGLVTTVTRGALQSEKVKVVEVVDANGATVFALTDLHHDHACGLAQSPSLIGYGCEASKSGAVPAKACVSGCE